MSTKRIVLMLLIALVCIPGEEGKPAYHGCKYDGKNYPLNSVIQDDECTKLTCEADGTVVIEDKCLDKVKTETFPKPAKRDAKPAPNHCDYKGKTYPLNSVIKKTNCTTTHCLANGRIGIEDKCLIIDTIQTFGKLAQEDAKPDAESCTPNSLIRVNNRCTKTICDSQGRAVLIMEPSCFYWG